MEGDGEAAEGKAGVRVERRGEERYARGRVVVVREACKRSPKWTPTASRPGKGSGPGCIRGIRTACRLPYQVQAIAWVMTSCRSELRGRVCSNEMGLGKTVFTRIVTPACWPQLKRTSATEINGVPDKGSYRIGAEIPPVRWLTVKLQMKAYEKRGYRELHRCYTAHTGAGYDDI